MSNSLNISMRPELQLIMGTGFDVATDTLEKLRDELTEIEGATFLTGQDDLATSRNNIVNIQGVGFNFVNDNLHEAKLLRDEIKAKTDLMNFTGSNIDAEVVDAGVLNNLSQEQVSVGVGTALDTTIPGVPTGGSVNDLLKIEKERSDGSMSTINQAYALSDTIIFSNDAVATTNQVGYTKIKEMICAITDTIRIKFEGRRTSAWATEVQIHKNGAGVGIERTVDTWLEYSEDLAFNTGDLIQIYAKSADAGNYAEVRNFRICGTAKSYFENTME